MRICGSLREAPIYLGRKLLARLDTGPVDFDLVNSAMLSEMHSKMCLVSQTRNWACLADEHKLMAQQHISC
jgi:hypothetical protein